MSRAHTSRCLLRNPALYFAVASFLIGSCGGENTHPSLHSEHVGANEESRGVTLTGEPVSIVVEHNIVTLGQEYHGYTDFDGHEMRTHINKPHESPYRFIHSALHSVADRDVETEYPGVLSEHEWTLLDKGLLANANVRWKDDDLDNYVAWGWWLYEYQAEYYSGEGDSVLNVQNVTTGAAYVAGREFMESGEWEPTTIPLPVTGSGEYNGDAVGIYIEDGSASEFRAQASLEANFTTGILAGCAGCDAAQPLMITPIEYDLGSGSITRQTAEESAGDFNILFLPASFLESVYRVGAFGGEVVINDPDGNWNGTWGGSFSTVADRNGQPRRVGLTFRAIHSEATALAGSLIGISADYADSLATE